MSQNSANLDCKCSTGAKLCALVVQRDLSLPPNMGRVWTYAVRWSNGRSQLCQYHLSGLENR
jgi:hypothetical protein